MEEILSDPFSLADFSAPAWQKLSELKAGWEKSVCIVVKGADNNQLILHSLISGYKSGVHQ